MTVTEFLHQHVGLLEGVNEDLAGSLARRIEQKHYQAGQTVVFRGMTVDGLHIVATGKVQVIDKSQKFPKVAELGPGEIFGEMSILSGGMASATVKCVDNDTTIFVLPQEVFKTVLFFNPELQARAESLVAQRKARNAAASPPRAP